MTLFPRFKLEMVFCYENCSNLQFGAEGLEFAIFIEMTRSIYSYREESVEFLKQNFFLTCS